MEFKINDLVKYYFKHIVLDLIVFIFALIIGLIYIFIIYEPEYVGKTTFMLGACVPECDEDSYIDIYFNDAVVKDYMELARTNLVLEKANEMAGTEYKTGELREMVDVAYEEDTQYIIVTVTSTNKKDSSVLSYNIYKALVDEVNRIFDISNIHLVDTSKAGSLKYSNSLLVIIAIIISFIISIVVMTIKFLFFSNTENNVPKLEAKEEVVKKNTNKKSTNTKKVTKKNTNKKLTNTKKVAKKNTKESVN